MKKKYIGGAALVTAFALMLSSAVVINENRKIDKESDDKYIPGWTMHADDPITLDWYVNYSWFVTGWGQNAVSKKITEETGVSINFITPVGNEEEKLNALISSNSLPDVITLGWWEPQIKDMIEKDMVYPLNELADKYDMYFYKVTDQSVIDWYRSEDGNIYCYPNSSYTPEDLEEHDDIPSNQTFLVRKDIYEAIGKPDMTTPEGFYQAVKDAVAMFPEVDGQPLIPIGTHVFDDRGCVSMDSYLQNFLAVPYEKDGQYYDRNTDPEYLTWLKMFRQLNEEGYLSPDIFVDTRVQMSEKIADGRYFCMLYQRTDMADQQKILYEKNPDSIYIAVDGPKNSNGDDPVLPSNGITGWTVTMISKNCKNPERAIEFMDYLMSEHGQMLTYLGVEGETYDIVDDKPVIRKDVADILKSDRETYDRLYGADNTYWMLQDNVMQLQWKYEEQDPLAQMIEWTYPYTHYLGQYEVMMLESSDVGQAYNKLNSLWSETLKKLLLAESDEEFDRIVEDYKVKRLDFGYEEVLKEETRQVQKNKEMLGIE